MEGVLKTESLSCINNVPIEVFDLNESTAKLDHISQECFGETPLSFRSLLKRFFAGDTFVVPASTGSNNSIFVRRTVLPSSNLTYGSSGWSSAPELFTYLRYSYLGCRGGIRKRISIIPSNGMTSQLSLIRSSFASPSVASSLVGYYITAPSANVIEGSIMEMPNTNGAVEIEFPFYTNNLFLVPCTDSYSYQTSTDVMNSFWYRVS